MSTAPRDEVSRLRQARARNANRVKIDAKGKLELPKAPTHDDRVGQCAWLTGVLDLDEAHPITGAVHEGNIGPDGHVALHRAGSARTIRFEPASRINQPAKLAETLSWWTLPTDGVGYTFTAAHCRHIAHVVRMLCGLANDRTLEQEMWSVIATFLSSATPVNGCTTYGTSPQRYEAAIELRRDVDQNGRPTGAPHYLVEAHADHADELVIGVSDLQQAARSHEGSSLPRGWLDARMEALHWKHITLDGHAAVSRSGVGPHARITAYRGVLYEPGADDTDPPPTT